MNYEMWDAFKIKEKEEGGREKKKKREERSKNIGIS